MTNDCTPTKSTTDTSNVKQAFAEHAMTEQRELWQKAEILLLQQFSQFYRSHSLNEKHLSSQEAIDANIKPANDILLVSEETEVMNHLRLYNSVKGIGIRETVGTRLKLVQGVPGCGKTTFIINNHREGDLVLFPTRDAAVDFRKRLKLKREETSAKEIKDSCRTVHSFIINSTDHLKNGGKYKRVIVDEALMLHAGEILFACALAGVSEALLIRDKNQIPYINRTPHDLKYFNILETAELTQVLSHSYRCSVADLLSTFYEQGMTTSNPESNESMLICPNGITNLQVNSGEYKILVFKQSEKLELSKMGYNISTIHEYQGRQAKNIIVIRTAKYKDEIYE
ncbi:hypothetical protein J6590_067735 [Homalodisca vitripennis]|nr:hypothetical protein J6590_067735 [Homalodisca vitripennis]